MIIYVPKSVTDAVKSRPDWPELEAAVKRAYRDGWRLVSYRGGLKMEAVYRALADRLVLDFARKYRFPGWYIDSTGCYGCVIGKCWICIFATDCGTLEITVDAVSEEGCFDRNLEWESPEDEVEMVLTVRRFMAKYGRD